jgi:hypothetical protein
MLESRQSITRNANRDPSTARNRDGIVVESGRLGGQDDHDPGRRSLLRQVGQQVRDVPSQRGFRSADDLTGRVLQVHLDLIEDHGRDRHPHRQIPRQRGRDLRLRTRDVVQCGHPGIARLDFGHQLDQVVPDRFGVALFVATHEPVRHTAGGIPVLASLAVEDVQPREWVQDQARSG